MRQIKGYFEKSNFIPRLVTLTFRKKLTILDSIFSRVITKTVTLTIKVNLIYPSNQKM